MKYKIYILVSLEALDKMNGIRGKLGAQCGHAVLHTWWDAAERFPEDAKAYKDSAHAYKITLAVPDEATLRKFEEEYRGTCGVSLVEDAGFTVFNEPTVTCIGIGPIPENRVREDLASLKLLR